jgi:hypothetical protein
MFHTEDGNELMSDIFSTIFGGDKFIGDPPDVILDGEFEWNYIGYKIDSDDALLQDGKPTVNDIAGDMTIIYVYEKGEPNTDVIVIERWREAGNTGNILEPDEAQTYENGDEYIDNIKDITDWVYVGWILDDEDFVRPASQLPSDVLTSLTSAHIIIYLYEFYEEPIEPTATPEPPTASPEPATATPEPPTASPEPATATPEPPSPSPTSADEPTATPAPIGLPTPTKTPGGSGGGGGGEVPELEKDDHIWYIRGYDDGEMRPEAAITRAEVAAILFRLVVDKNKDKPLDITFADVKFDAWYSQHIAYLTEKGIIKGRDDGLFYPDDYINRAEVAALVSRFERLEKGAIFFPDVTKENCWAWEYIASAAAKGWIKGYEDGTCRPFEKLTRAETVALFNRMLERKLLRDDVNPKLNTYIDLVATHWAYADFIEASYHHTYKRKGIASETWLEVFDERDYDNLKK